MVHIYSAKFVRKQFKNKGFNTRTAGHTTRHGVFILTDLDGNDTKTKLPLFKQHKGTKGDINHWKLKAISSQLNLYDTKFLSLFIDCERTHKDLLEKLGII